MKNLKTNLKDGFSNWSRFQTIVAVFAKHGFSGVLHELGLIPLKQNGDAPAEDTIPKKLRLAFEELGPTFIKLGQVLSTRPDLFSEAYIVEFSKLTDQIPAFPFSEVENILEKEFGQAALDLFEWIDPVPLAAASIAQVHRARLKDNPVPVVIKIQRPGILKTIQNDIHVLHTVARLLEKFNKDFELLNATALVKEFQRTIYEELDFTLEARHIEKFSENFPDTPGIRIPQVIWPCTSKRVLTMSELPGVSLAQIKDIPKNVDRRFLAESLVTFFFESIFFHGFFHADAHAGNILIDSEGRGSLGLLDFGMVGSIGPELRAKLSKLFLSVVARDFESLASSYSEISNFSNHFSLKEFQEDISEFLAPNLEKPLREIEIGQMLLDSTRIARKYRIKLPRDLIMFFRSLMTLEHIGRRLDPDFEFMTYGQKFAHSLIRRRFSSDEIFRDLFKTIEGLRTLSTELPPQLTSLLQKLERQETSTSHDFEAIKSTQKLMVLSFLCFGSLMGATLLSSFHPEHFMNWPLWIAATVTGLFLVLKIFRSKSL